MVIFHSFFVCSSDDKFFVAHLAPCLPSDFSTWDGACAAHRAGQVPPWSIDPPEGLPKLRCMDTQKHPETMV
jgi:hypothetical protein